MPRPHIESIRAVDAPAGQAPEPFGGTTWRRLSHDGETGAQTALVELPAGFAATLPGSGRPVELLVLAGRGTIGGQRLRAGTWAWAPPGSDAELRLDEAGLALVMVEEERDDAGELEVIDTESARHTGATTAVPPGLAIKMLRIDPVTRDRSWIAAMVPGNVADRAETHPTVEEAFCLRGDCFLLNSGEMKAGDYFWRPEDVLHGPFATRAGVVFFFRTKGGDMVVDFHDVPEWPEACERYVTAEPFFVPA